MYLALGPWHPNIKFIGNGSRCPFLLLVGLKHCSSHPVWLQKEHLRSWLTRMSSPGLLLLHGDLKAKDERVTEAPTAEEGMTQASFKQGYIPSVAWRRIWALDLPRSLCLVQPHPSVCLELSCEALLSILASNPTFMSLLPIYPGVWGASIQ